jgi:hypothetical protein
MRQISLSWTADAMIDLGPVYGQSGGSVVMRPVDDCASRRYEDNATASAGRGHEGTGARDLV